MLHAESLLSALQDVALSVFVEPMQASRRGQAGGDEMIWDFNSLPANYERRQSSSSGTTVTTVLRKDTDGHLRPLTQKESVEVLQSLGVLSEGASKTARPSRLRAFVRTARQTLSRFWSAE